jgi:hypothetical protein
MSQRPSGYARRPDEDYATVEWPVLALLAALQFAPVDKVWDPCNGAGKLVATLRAQGFDAIGTSEDFLTVTAAPIGVSDLITNPPYGSSRRGELAVQFIEHALELNILRIAMLLRVDFDSALTRQHVFRCNPSFAGKIVLLNRIKWFEGPSSPSDNHAWFLWNREHQGAPSIQYVTRREAEAAMS